MKLLYTPRSHFARKVRILLDAYGIPATLVDAGDVGRASPQGFGSNPLMKVPTLVDGEVTVFDSDYIAEYLVRRHDPQDRFGVLSIDPFLKNARAVLNGAMAAEVEIILARRSGIDTRGLPRFEKLAGSIGHALDWLEARADALPTEPSYTGFHLVCLWDHLGLYDLAELDHPRVLRHVNRLSELPFVVQSRPPGV